VRPTVTLALPIMAGMMGHMLMGLADTLMVGQVGVVPLAAAAFVNTVTHLPMVFAFGLLSSVSVFCAQAFGAREPEVVGEVMRHGVFMAVLAGLVAAVAGAALLPFLSWFGQPPEVVRASRVYLVIVSASMLPLLVAHAGKQISESLNRPWTPTWLLLGGVLLNVFLNWILIYGHWGVPALGLEGAGWATLIARIVTAVAVIVYLKRSVALRIFQPKRWFARIDWSRVRRLCAVGLPVGVQHLLEVSAFAFAALMMGWISAEALAAHQIAITCAATTFMCSWGLAMAVCIRVGHAWGSGQYARMRRVGFVGVVLSAMVMGGFALAFVLGGRPIADLFVDSAAVVALAAQMLVVAAVFQVADGVQVVSICALRGLTDVRVPAWIAVLAYWVIAVPLGSVLAFVAGLGAVGIWVGLATGLGVAALLLLIRWHLKSRIG
jgi:MATE family multidrug resistance protein